MGKSVTVDSDDLQTLLFATGTIKQIEAAIKQHKQDHQVMMAQDNLTRAHDTLAKAWRNAVRVIEDPIYNDPLTAKELEYLKLVDSVSRVIQTEDLTSELVRTLRRKGMLELGVRSTQTNWGDTGLGPIEFAENVIRITARASDTIYPPDTLNS